MIRLKTLLREWTGETWSSCRQWRSHRSRYMSGENSAIVTFQKSSTMFQLEYVGPHSGISLAHASGSSGDTLHQLFNILICELNEWLIDKNLKPMIQDIVTRCTKDGNTYIFLIQVPLMTAEAPWQLNHRGGWRKADPGDAEVKSLDAYNKSMREGPARNVTTIPGNNSIYTYFITYPL